MIRFHLSVLQAIEASTPGLRPATGSHAAGQLADELSIGIDGTQIAFAYASSNGKPRARDRVLI